MTYDETKALVERLEKFRVRVQARAADGCPMVVTDNQDHLLREAILCIEELQKKAAADPVRYYSSTRETYPYQATASTPGYDEYVRKAAIEDVRRILGANDMPRFPYGLGSTQIKSQLESAAAQVKFLKYANPMTDPCLD